MEAKIDGLKNCLKEDMEDLKDGLKKGT